MFKNKDPYVHKEKNETNKSTSTLAYHEDSNEDVQPSIPLEYSHHCHFLLHPEEEDW